MRWGKVPLDAYIYPFKLISLASGAGVPGVLMDASVELQPGIVGNNRGLDWSLKGHGIFGSESV